MSLQPSSPAVPTQRKGRFHGASINLFYLPVIILLVVFIVYPLVNGFFLSLTNWDGYSPDKSFVGALNYKQLFKDANFKLVLVNTLVYGVGSTIIQQILGLGLALLLNARIKGRNLLRAIIYQQVQALDAGARKSQSPASHHLSAGFGRSGHHGHDVLLHLPVPAGCLEHCYDRARFPKAGLVQ